jgi:hypothetical protein
MPIDVERALKDKQYFDSLTDAERAMVRAKAKTRGELGESDLDQVSGGVGFPSCDAGSKDAAKLVTKL